MFLRGQGFVFSDPLSLPPHSHSHSHSAKIMTLVTSPSLRVKKTRKPVKILTKATKNHDILRLPVHTFPSTSKCKTTLNNARICMTPINPDQGYGITMGSAYSRRHYMTEKSYYTGKMQWDQPVPNKTQAQIGDLFAFVMTAGTYDKMEIFEIVDVGETTDRRIQWDLDIPEQSNKGVMYLSEYMGWVTTKSYVDTMKRFNDNARIPVVTDPMNKNFGKLLMKNSTQVYPWSSEIIVNIAD